MVNQPKKEWCFVKITTCSVSNLEDLFCQRYNDIVYATPYALQDLVSIRSLLSRPHLLVGLAVAGLETGGGGRSHKVYGRGIIYLRTLGRSQKKYVYI